LASNCFNHRTTPAVGICKSCGKGVCPACAADTGHGLACRDACEERVDLLDRMVARNARVLRAADAQSRSSGLYLLATGAVFLACGWWGYASGNGFLTLFCGGLGLIAVIFGLLRITTERFPRPDR
jgi:hypothetical protein